MSLLLLDFDGTLFNTTDFIEEFWTRIQQSTGSLLPPIAQVNIELQPFAKDWVGYLRGRGLSQTDIDKTFAATGGDFLYDDVLPQLTRLTQQYETRILTSGLANWQRAKLQLSGILDHIDASVVLGNKGELIKREIQQHKKHYRLSSHSPNAHDEVLLVDDKEDVLRPLKNHRAMRLFLIDRQNKLAAKNHPDWYSYIQSLKEIS